MENQERSLFSRMQPSRDSIRLQIGRKGFEAGGKESGKQIGERHSVKEQIGPSASPGKYAATPRPVVDNLKQWELVECGQSLRVVEKRIGVKSSLPREESSDVERAPSLVGRKTPPSESSVAIDANLEQKLKAFKDSKIVQPIVSSQRERTDDGKVPINLELILKQPRKGSAIESTDMLQRLEQQVKAIEMDTLAARTRQLEFSSDFEPEIRYADLHRYREHEDLLRNVTDNEAEG